MITEFSLEKIVEPAVSWYDENHRILPWRKNREAYQIWISEIMLQQTRVEAVIDYYNRFLKELPDVFALAKCPQDRLLKLWEGLGYYTRARNLQKAATTIVEEYDGKMPEDYSELMKLSGIGSYTARAIASQAYGQPVSAVDGNVIRVLTRLSRDSSDSAKASFKSLMEKKLDLIIPTDRPGDFNQAMMELGAMVCVPNGEPHCEQCPLKEICLGYQNKDMRNYPVKAPKKARKVEKRTVFLLRNGEQVLLRQREARGLLAGLYEFPNELGWLTKEEGIVYSKSLGLSPVWIKELPEAKHIFSHVEWQMIGYEVRIDETQPLVGDYIFAQIDEVKQRYSIPTAFEAYRKVFDVEWKKDL